jgi:DNA-binding transcriptional ArsR family regulator
MILFNHMVEYGARLDTVFHSLSDPTRRDILRRVSRDRLTVSKVAKIYERQMSLAAVSKHLMVLERASLIRKRRHGREQVVELSPAALKDAKAYLERYRVMWEGRLDRLEAYLKTKN